MRIPSKYLGAALLLCLCTPISEQATCQSTISPPASQASPNDSRIRHRPKGLLAPYHPLISAADTHAKTFPTDPPRQSRHLHITDPTPIPNPPQPPTPPPTTNHP